MRDTAKSREIIIHTDVIQLIQVTEHTNLRKLCDTGQKRKTEVTVRTLQYPVKSL